MSQKRVLISWLILSLGVWLIAAPLTFGYTFYLGYLTDCYCGLGFLILGSASLFHRRFWLGWIVALIGLFLQLAPLVFWAPSALIYLNETCAGLIAMILGFQLNKKEDLETTDTPSGWSFNPSGWSHRLPLAILALVCASFARYMAVFQLGYRDTVWDPFFSDGTLKVITSALSRSFPVSDAGLGAVCYTIEFLLAWQGGQDRWRSMPWLVCSFAFLVIPVGAVSVLLIISQPLLVGSWCSWCLATAFLMLIMIILAASEFMATVQFLIESKQKGESAWVLFWKGREGKETSHKKVVKLYKKGIKSGWSLHFPLIFCAVLGFWLVLSPSLLSIYTSFPSVNFVVGPLAVALSFISSAEVFRSLRYLHILLGFFLLASALFLFFSEGGSWGVFNNLIVGVLLILFCRSRGKIHERYGSFQCYIF